MQLWARLVDNVAHYFRYDTNQWGPGADPEGELGDGFRYCYQYRYW